MAQLLAHYLVLTDFMFYAEESMIESCFICAIIDKQLLFSKLREILIKINHI